MKVKKNPFQILGLNPDTIRGLKDEEILILVESQYKALQKIFHPDKPRGNEEKSKLISDARMILDPKKHPEEFEVFKRQFLKKSSMKSQIDQLKTELKTAKDLTNLFYLVLLDYLKASADISDETTVFNIEPCIISLHDYRFGMNLPLFESEELHRKHKEKKNNPAFFELEVNADNTITKIKLGDKTNFTKTLIGTISSSMLKKKKGLDTMSRVLKLAQHVWSPEMAIMKGLMTGKRTDYSKVVYAEERIPAESFMPIMGMVRPQLNVHDYLFSISQDHKGTFFTFEGTIVDIKPLN
ncbi:DnaJ family molecular chaperone [Patescibacteria group bacterium]